MSEQSGEHRPRRCDFLVNGRDGVKVSHVFLFIFGAVLWASNLISVLDETDMMAATLPKAATGEERSTHNAIVILFRCILIFRSCALPALTAAGAVVSILTDGGGASLTGGAPVAVEPVITFVAAFLNTTHLLRFYSRAILFARFPQVFLSCFRLSCSPLLRIWMRRSARSLRGQTL